MIGGGWCSWPSPSYQLSYPLSGCRRLRGGCGRRFCWHWAMRSLWWRAIRSQARRGPEFDGRFSLPSSGSRPQVFSHISGILVRSLRRSSTLLFNIYLLLGLLWAAIYLATDAFSPGSIRIGSDPSDRQTELLYFSLITLSTVGYGDIVPLSGMARILTALEGVTGVLYIATTVAVLVGRFRNESWE
jgi:hypothetical protein